LEPARHAQGERSSAASAEPESTRERDRERRSNAEPAGAVTPFGEMHKYGHQLSSRSSFGLGCRDEKWTDFPVSGCRGCGSPYPLRERHAGAGQGSTPPLPNALVSFSRDHRGSLTCTDALLRYSCSLPFLRLRRPDRTVTSSDARRESRSASRTCPVSRAGNSKARPASITRRPTPSGHAANSRRLKTKWRVAMLECIRPASDPGAHTPGRIAKAPKVDGTVHASKSVLFGSLRNARTSYALPRPASAAPVDLFCVSMNGPCSNAVRRFMSRLRPLHPRRRQPVRNRSGWPERWAAAHLFGQGCARLPAGRPIHGPQIHLSDSG
jgi:hypothetical protein